MITRSATLLGLCLSVGCGGGETEECNTDTQGTLEVSIYGEEFIEESIPAAEFVDGWEVAFSKFLVHLSSVEAQRSGCASDVDDATGWVFDLSKHTGGDGQAVLSAEVPAGQYGSLSYRIGPTDSATNAGNAQEVDKSLMRQEGYSVYVAGTATHPTHGSRSFAWGFDRDTSYESCESQAEVGDGLTGRSQLTIHADHLFYDDLVSPEPNVAFDLLDTADSNGDHDITADELLAQSIIGQDRYGVGNYTSIVDLWHFIDHLVATLGHIDGEGHCHAEL